MMEVLSPNNPGCGLTMWTDAAASLLTNVNTAFILKAVQPLVKSLIAALHMKELIYQYNCWGILSGTDFFEKLYIHKQMNTK